jgi:hypothetical protein
MEFTGVHYAIAPPAILLPAKNNWPAAGANHESMRVEIMRWHFLRLVPMGLHHDPAPAPGRTGPGDGTGTRDRKRLAGCDINQCDFAGLLAVAIPVDGPELIHFGKTLRT